MPHSDFAQPIRRPVRHLSIQQPSETNGRGRPNMSLNLSHMLFIRLLTLLGLPKVLFVAFRRCLGTDCFEELPNFERVLL
jgi:hypothetical protein